MKKSLLFFVVALQMVALSTAYADFVGVGMSNSLFTRKTLNSPWQAIPQSGKVIAIANR
jgi:multidrug transporter EmrE-like cation transporter